MADNGLVPAIGWFQATPSQEVPGAAADAESLWIVYKWEALRPVVALPPFDPTAASPGLRLWERVDRTPLRLRHNMLRAIIRGVLRAVDKCHRGGVVHGSLGTGSIMLNTFDDTSADAVIVKLDNFGFAQRISGSGDDSWDAPSGPLAHGRRMDCQALAVAICEIVFCAALRSSIVHARGRCCNSALLTGVAAQADCRKRGLHRMRPPSSAWSMTCTWVTCRPSARTPSKWASGPMPWRSSATWTAPAGI